MKLSPRLAPLLLIPCTDKLAADLQYLPLRSDRPAEQQRQADDLYLRLAAIDAKTAALPTINSILLAISALIWATSQGSWWSHRRRAKAAGGWSWAVSAGRCPPRSRSA